MKFSVIKQQLFNLENARFDGKKKLNWQHWSSSWGWLANRSVSVRHENLLHVRAERAPPLPKQFVVVGGTERAVQAIGCACVCVSMHEKREESEKPKESTFAQYFFGIFNSKTIKTPIATTLSWLSCEDMHVWVRIGVGAQLTVILQVVRVRVSVRLVSR